MFVQHLFPPPLHDSYEGLLSAAELLVSRTELET